jgi:microcystin-dependent protein
MNLAATPVVTVADNEITTAKILDANVTAAKLAGTLDLSGKTVTLPAAIAVPAGAVMAFAMNAAPAGWLAANGAAVSRSTYATLFAAISTTHGVGDGSTTFNLPDLRGIFVRGSGDQTISGTLYSKAFALKETDNIKAHQHSFTDAIWEAPGGQPIFGPNSGNRVTSTLTTSGGPTGAETRPANIALLYCVKF